MDGRPTLQKRLTLRDLNVDATSDAESISVANDEPLSGGSHHFIDESMRSDSNHGADQDDVQLLVGTSAHEQLLENLAKLGISEDIDTTGMEELHRRLSDVTFSDKSYIMDLGRQQASREDTIRKEAFEESHVWFEKALARGMPESKELFAGIFSQMTEEVRERYVEFHKKQDERLNQALDDYQKKLSEEQLEKIQKAAPTDDDVKKQKLSKKISKIEKLMKKASKKEGEDSEVYLNYAKKLAEYKARRDLLEVPKSRKCNDSTKGKSKDASSKKKSSSKPKPLKQLDVDDEEMSTKSKKSTKTTRTSKKLKNKKDIKKKKGSGSSKSPRNSADEDTIKSSSTKHTSKKKKEKPERQPSLPT